MQSSVQDHRAQALLGRLVRIMYTAKGGSTQVPWYWHHQTVRVPALSLCPHVKTRLSASG